MELEFDSPVLLQIQRWIFLGPDICEMFYWVFFLWIGLHTKYKEIFGKERPNFAKVYMNQAIH